MLKLWWTPKPGAGSQPNGLTCLVVYIIGILNLMLYELCYNPHITTVYNLYNWVKKFTPPKKKTKQPRGRFFSLLLNGEKSLCRTSKLPSQTAPRRGGRRPVGPKKLRGYVFMEVQFQNKVFKGKHLKKKISKKSFRYQKCRYSMYETL